MHGLNTHVLLPGLVVFVPESPKMAVIWQAPGQGCFSFQIGQFYRIAEVLCAMANQAVT